MVISIQVRIEDADPKDLFSIVKSNMKRSVLRPLPIYRTGAIVARTPDAACVV